MLLAQRGSRLRRLPDGERYAAKKPLGAGTTVGTVPGLARAFGANIDSRHVPAMPFGARTKGKPMEWREIKSRVDAKLDARKRSLDAMRVKVEASEGDERSAYREEVAALEKQHKELKTRAAQAWEAAARSDARWDSEVEDIERTLDEWTKGVMAPGDNAPE